MSYITELCEQICEQVEAISYPLSKHLQPGLSNDELMAIQTTLPFVFPDSLIEMYKWRNGTSIGPDIGVGGIFFPWWYFTTINESLERYKVMSNPELVELLWRINCFPFMSSSDISSFGICCGEAKTSDGEIICYDHTSWTRVEYVSLQAMLETILAAYKEGVIFLGKDGDLSCDFDRFAEIEKQFNPGLKRWE